MCQIERFLPQKDYNKVSAIVSFMEEHGEIIPDEEYSCGLVNLLQDSMTFEANESPGSVDLKMSTRLNNGENPPELFIIDSQEQTSASKR